jgi:hypothetical protein
MLTKRRLLISTLLSTLMLTNTISAQKAGLDCNNGACYVNVKKFTHSKNISNKTNTFKRTPQVTFMKPLMAESDLRVTHKEPHLETFNLASKKYIQQKDEVLEPLTEEEENTIIFAPEKYVANTDEREEYYEQQKAMGIEELELIEPSLPMSLYYCRNHSEPVFDEKLHMFQCII